MSNCKISFLLVLSFCFLLGMATKAEVENVKETIDSVDVSADIGELKIELVHKIESVSDYLMSQDGEILLYSPKKAGLTRASDVRMLNISEDPKTKVLSFKKTRSAVDIDPEILDASWTELFDDKIIYKGDESGYSAGAVKLITGKLDGSILSKITCYYDDCIPVTSPTGKYIALIPSYNSDYPSLQVYETGTGRKMWEKFTPTDVNRWEEIPPFYITASFVSDDSLAVYYDKKIRLFDTKTGETRWEMTIIKNADLPPWKGAQVRPDLTTAKNGSILFAYGDITAEGEHKDIGYIYSISSNGVLKWKMKSQTKVPRISRISSSGEFAVVDQYGVITLFSNIDGKILWEKEGRLTWNRIFYSLGDVNLIIEGKIAGDNKIYIIKSNTGEILKSFDGKNLFVSRDGSLMSYLHKDTLNIYQLSGGDNAQK